MNDSTQSPTSNGVVRRWDYFKDSWRPSATEMVVLISAAALWIFSAVRFQAYFGVSGLISLGVLLIGTVGTCWVIVDWGTGRERWQPALALGAAGSTVIAMGFLGLAGIDSLWVEIAGGVLVLLFLISLAVYAKAKEPDVQEFLRSRNEGR